MIKVLHIVGGSPKNGAFKGAYILHKALCDLNVDSKILSDHDHKKNFKKGTIININNSTFKKLISKIYILIEKILKSLFLPIPRETFTLSLFGADITNLKEYKEADIIHFHWLSQGFISLNSLSKITKPTIWTMRDMWAFTGGSHYSMDFKNYEKGFISKVIQKFKRKIYLRNFRFVAVSNWIKNKANKSNVLKNHNIHKIDNNIDLDNFHQIPKEMARKNLKIFTKKKIILYGAQNPQSQRKGWNIFIETLKKLDKSKYFLLIFGNFWSHKVLDDIGIEYKSLGFINDKKKLNNVYACADLFVASSVEDAWPKTFAEAMFCGTPAVCFENTSISEIVDHKVTGFIVEKFDSNKLLEGIDWLSEEVIRNKSICNKARKKIFDFDPKKIAKKYIYLYEEILKNK
jgi:glycosyltransferase involved in cell wall biosynthesis|tara:strand:+ start:238 stop:1446 length:1209 start_codon:yes stop_codon:yes gene_type:complete